MEIGFIGLGRMGSAMARNLIKAGHKVHASSTASICITCRISNPVISRPFYPVDKTVLITFSLSEYVRGHKRRMDSVRAAAYNPPIPGEPVCRNRLRAEQPATR